MRTHVAFLRAVNVGGRTVRMDELRRVCESIPLANVATFIASGNVLFDSKRSPGTLERLIEKAIRDTFGFEVPTMVRTGAELAMVLDQVQARGMRHGDGATLYVGFLKTAPSRTVCRAAADLSTAVDQLEVHGRELYWQCHTSFAESTIAAVKLEKLLGTSATLRNLNTVRKLATRTSTIRLP